ncbi:hypothetical protein Cs7R123_06160 [Catellatospora sp. TT07R-123]|nr:hypothetical protein Cs7R123_06160 [Catellatospora sp. TT07R-123]
MLAGMALKRRWAVSRGRTSTDRPNLVMGVNVQVCWDKFCNYWEVEPRLVPMDGDRFHLSAQEAVARCDENTIGVVAILDSTFDGSYEPVAEIAAALDDLQERTGWNIPLHVDGASGAMVAPFLDVSRRLRERGWLVPAYTFPQNRPDLAVLRIVVRNGFSHDLADLLLDDLDRLLPELAAQSGPQHRPEAASAFHH